MRARGISLSALVTLHPVDGAIARRIVDSAPPGTGPRSLIAFGDENLVVSKHESLGVVWAFVVQRIPGSVRGAHRSAACNPAGGRLEDVLGQLAVPDDQSPDSCSRASVQTEAGLEVARSPNTSGWSAPQVVPPWCLPPEGSWNRPCECNFLHDYGRVRLSTSETQLLCLVSFGVPGLTFPRSGHDYSPASLPDSILGVVPARLLRAG